ncbi:MAG TPA: COX15/CtaA family protein [Candidatus Bathyarchaeia archaeon]|nr:COX15/CtaA family protein [Candidatus Bathyarchaeia archaeon]
MIVQVFSSRTRWLQVFAYGAVVSTYILILLGGYVTTSNSGLGCGESWPLCKNQVLPLLNDPQLVIEFAHRVFNIVVTVFVAGTAVLAWTRFRGVKNVLLFSTAGFAGLVAQVILGMVTVKTGLDPVVSDAHLGLASAVFAIVVVNAVLVWNLHHGLRNQVLVAARTA